MKTVIEYRYDQSNHYPFIADTHINGEYYIKVSNISFEDAKTQLLEEIKRLAFRPIPEIPKEEEVEIEELQTV